MRFSDLADGDVFTFDALIGREAWVKTASNQAHVVNQDYARNVAGDERVTLLIAQADRPRQEILRPDPRGSSPDPKGLDRKIFS